MSAVPLLYANLAVVLESPFYGIYVILFLLALYLKVTDRRDSEQLTGVPLTSRRKLVSPLVFGALLLFVFISSHWILNVICLFLAFKEAGPGPQIFYAHPTEVMKYIFLGAAWFIGDLFLIHRLWAVWAFRTRIIIVPTVALIGFVAFGAGLIYQLSGYKPNDSIFRAPFRRWTTGICVFSLTTTTYTTGFIWYKLWTTSRVLKMLGVTSLSTIMRIFIDSAALVTVWGSFHVITYQCGSNLQFIAADCMPAVLGISNLLIQIRLYFTKTQASESCPNFIHQIRFATDQEESRGDVDPEGDGKGTLP
ncbi:hypothetical protein FB451DRAFT_1133839 [Mycena latifolia]|nr:hypothetical protein FB451DRAFT_1133839 [Mycena latifolia]